MILNDNSTQQINTLVIQLQNRITNLTNESRKLNKEISDLGSEISDLEIRVNSNSNDDADMNTEISDLERRVSSLANDASAMNTAILANTEAISGKADKIHTHTKSQITDFPTSLKNPNALTVNGKTYDGSTAVDAGVQTIENGGTGATTALDAFESLANGLPEGAGPLDTEHIIFQNENRKNWGLYTLSQFWEYIKGKISSVLGLTGNKLTLLADSGADLSSYGNEPLSIGFPSGTGDGLSLGFDRNSIQARNNGAADVLYLNYYGGGVKIGNGGVTGSKLTIQGNAINSNSYTDTNPKLEFKNDDGAQNISLTFTDADAVKAPASLTLNGNQGNEYFIAPCIKANSKLIIPIGAPSSLEDGCIWIER
ncbi:MAG: hypothetical protein SPF22_07315 [Candidatus Onthovivens sp.]|nr:hypothetical protein [Candidatus Onthovivens sp.]